MKDKWNAKPPVLRLDDLIDRDDSLPIKLSILMTVNDFRKGQLARSLECLCRQRWKEFEVLICDNGGPHNLQEVFDIFDPFLRLNTVRLERSRYSACPSVGFRALLPKAKGEVIAIMQPEIMLFPEATWFLYDVHFNEWPNIHRYKISTANTSMFGVETWAVLKPAFFSEDAFGLIDEIDWHSDIRKIETLPYFNSHTSGLSRMTNQDVRARRHYPWWFVGSARASAHIWEDIPAFYEHASIDQWLLSFRRIHQYVDLCPRDIMGYHQWHHREPQGSMPDRADIMPDIVVSEGEASSWKPMSLGELQGICKQYDFDPAGHEYDDLLNHLTIFRDAEANIRGLGDDRLVNEPQANEPQMKSVRLRRIHEANCT